MMKVSHVILKLILLPFRLEAPILLRVRWRIGASNRNIGKISIKLSTRRTFTFRNYGYCHPLVTKCSYFCVYSKWGDEVLLESAIGRIQNVLEEECDKYFKDIAPKAIKVMR